MKETVFRIVHWACRIGLAAIFFYSGYVKLQAPLQFAADLMGYQLFPAQLIFPVATYFPWVEIALGVFLLIGWRIRNWAMAASAMIIFFISIITITYARGIDANCGCFGTGEKISPFTMVRDSLILLPALFLALENRIRRFRQTRGTAQSAA